MPKISDNVQKLLETKNYFQKNENTWEDICKRVSKNIASAEETKELKLQYEEIFFNMMNDMYFIPSTPCLLNSGTNVQQLSSCFIVDIDDSIEGIMNTAAECAKIFQKSGGAGFNISNLRPRGSKLKNSGGCSSGAVSFMRIFNAIVEEVKHGNSRKGALKVDLDCSHPDIFEFIHCKDDTGQLQNMNISVSITDDFLNAVVNDDDWELKFNNKIYKTIKAKELWDEIITSAWKTGEPGLTFVTIADEGNMNPHLGDIKSSNPCSEYINIPYSSCNLGSINLLKFVEDKKFNLHKFEQYIRYAVRFLDNMISVNKLPIPKIQEVTELIRPIGLGTMGLADAMFAMEKSMSSKDGLKAINNIYSILYNVALNTTKSLAEEKGVYPAWEGSVCQEKGIKVRNSSLISIAPNGSIAFFAGVNGGIEPIFALCHMRRTANGDEYFVINSTLEEELKKLNLFNDKILDKIINNNGSVRGISEIPQKIQNVFITAMDMTPEEHLRCLEAASKHVDLSVSKTINLSKNATKDDVADVYLKAWQTGVIKGITVYRDGSRDDQVLSVRKTEDIKNIIDKELPRGFVLETPDDVKGKRRKLYTGCGTLYLKVFYDDLTGELLETFLSKGSSGGCERYMQFSSRLMSRLLRMGDTADGLYDQAQSTPSCPSWMYKVGKGEKLSKGKSCPSAIANAILEIQREIKDELDIEEVPIISKEVKITYLGSDNKKCPECGEELTMSGGCSNCVFCGFSKCD